jgi:hypothetical protein
LVELLDARSHLRVCRLDVPAGDSLPLAPAISSQVSLAAQFMPVYAISIRAIF